MYAFVSACMCVDVRMLRHQMCVRMSRNWDTPWSTKLNQKPERTVLVLNTIGMAVLCIGL